MKPDRAHSESASDTATARELARGVLHTPLGRLRLTAGARGLTRVDLLAPGDDAACADAADCPPLRAAARALAQYFAGERSDFADLPLDPRGTPFQQRVWRALRAIPRGSTVSYRELAGRLGEPRAVRAVGRANARNPLPIVVPCHRVIGCDRRLTGFGLGLEAKAWLLVHEGAAAPFGEPPTARSRLEPPGRFTGAASSAARCTLPRPV